MQVNTTDRDIHWYLVCKSGKVPSDQSPCGIFTRGFIATPISPVASTSSPQRDSSGKSPQLQEDKAKLFWLKDSWRPSSCESEISVYNELKARGIPHLPEVLHAGDICDEATPQSTLNDSVLLITIGLDRRNL